MGIRLGPFDPIQLIFNVMNTLMQKGLMSYEDTRKIIKESLPPDMSNEEKEKLLDSLVKKK